MVCTRGKVVAPPLLDSTSVVEVIQLDSSLTSLPISVAVRSMPLNFGMSGLSQSSMLGTLRSLELGKSVFKPTKKPSMREMQGLPAVT
jgi:hypothetical protein